MYCVFACNCSAVQAGVSIWRQSCSHHFVFRPVFLQGVRVSRPCSTSVCVQAPVHETHLQYETSVSSCTSWPLHHRMGVIAEGIAHAASHGHLLGASTVRRKCSSFRSLPYMTSTLLRTIQHRENLDQTDMAEHHLDPDISGK